MSHKNYDTKQNKSESDAKKRFFVASANLGKTIIDGEEHLHLTQVMRYKVGDQIILICDDEFDYYGTIVDIKKDCTIVDVFKKEPNSANPKVDITAYVAMNKRDTTSLMIRMSSELGVSHFVPIITKWTLKQDVTEKIDRFQKIADQSAKQCRRSKTLKIEKPKLLADVLSEFCNFDAVLFAFERENQAKFEELSKNAKKIAFLIGPVAGFDDDEANQIVNAGATPISLGKRILRADTACICMASLISSKFDWLQKYSSAP